MEREKLYLFTLHESESDFRVKGAVIARSPREASSILGGEFVEVDGWPMGSSTNPDELDLYGRIRFDKDLFRSHSDEELCRIPLDWNPGLFYEKDGFHIWLKPGKNEMEFILRRHPITLPDYVKVTIHCD